jgi:hypothetical protein
LKVILLVEPGGLSPERQREILSEAIEQAREMVRTADDLKMKLKCMNTLGVLNKELNNVQRTLYTLGKSGRARRNVTELPVGEPARTSAVDVAANG